MRNHDFETIKVKEWQGYFLRDDTEIRRSAGCFEDQIEGYSLFRTGKDYGREKVFAGPKEWAIEQAEKEIAICNLQQEFEIICNGEAYNLEHPASVVRINRGTIMAVLKAFGKLE